MSEPEKRFKVIRMVAEAKETPWTVGELGGQWIETLAFKAVKGEQPILIVKGTKVAFDEIHDASPVAVVSEVHIGQSTESNWASASYIKPLEDPESGQRGVPVTRIKYGDRIFIRKD